MQTRGIHHITAIAGGPQQNIDFYVGVLGLRLVKRTVNFDDPGSYHFYFGDHVGTPGTIITFFPWPGARRGTRGSNQVTAASFAVSSDSMDYWRERLKAHRIPADKADSRFDEPVLRFADPDGLTLEMIGSGLARTGDDGTSTVAAEHQISGFAAPTLQVSRSNETEKLLTEILGFQLVVGETRRRRFRVGGGSAAASVDIISSNAAPGHIAAGSVHHIAFRAKNDEEQLHWRELLVGLGYTVSPVMDRQYFHSIYFREPSGILFEIATDGPGFTVDESAEVLGETLKLPPAYEAMRHEIEHVLPPVELPLLATK